MAGRQGNIVHRFLYEGFLEYFEKEEVLVDYFLMDYILRVGYERCPQFRSCIDSVPLNNESIDFFLKNDRKRFDKQIYEQAISGSIGFKLTYKREMGQCLGTYGAAFWKQFVRKNIK